MRNASEKGQLSGYKGEMKKLQEPFHGSIEVNSLSSISNEEWISVLYNSDDNQFDERPDPKDIAAAF